MLAVSHASEGGIPWRIDEDRLDDAVLALLHLTLDGDGRAWKGFDWEAMNRLHAKGLIFDPVGKAKSVGLTQEGIRRSKDLFAGLIPRKSPPSLKLAG